MLNPIKFFSIVSFILFSLSHHANGANLNLIRLSPERIDAKEYHIDRIDQKLYPYVGLLYSDKTPRGTAPCSAVLVSSNLVLTAFHCINKQGKLAQNIEFALASGESVTAEPLLFATENRWPRSMPPLAKVTEEALLIQAEDLLLLALKAPITSVAPVKLANVQAGSIPGEIFAVGSPNFKHVELPEPTKFETVLKYKNTIHRILEFDGMTYFGMSGGGAFIKDATGEMLLIGIIGAGLGNDDGTFTSYVMAPSLYEEIYARILITQK